MTSDEFKKWGYEFVDWVADYLAQSERYRVLAKVEPGQVRSQLPTQAPEDPEPFDRILRDLSDVIVPGLTHWNHPSFFAYFPNTGSEPGILAEMVTAALNVNGMLWRTSPAATELEEHVLDWLRQLIGLPASFRGLILDTASSSTFHALAAAREALEGWNVRENGISGPAAPRLRMYASDQAHSSVEKSAMALGLGRKGIALIESDSTFRMDVQKLEAAIQQDVRDGWTPFAVVATVGTTSTTSIDPVAKIADVCERHRLWLHVDAAYAGSAAIVPEFRYILDGCERADSFVTNPHKWLLTPMDLSTLYCRRPEMLRKAFSLTPEYLQTSETGPATNTMELTLQLGRRFRALKLWMVIRHYGAERLRATIREHVRLAKMITSLISSDPRFEIMAPVPLSAVCFRLRAGDRETQALIDGVNTSGEIFISHTKLRGILAARVAIGNLRTEERHVRQAWAAILSTTQEILSEVSS